MTMDRAEAVLFREGVRRALSAKDPVAAQNALGDLGWIDALEGDRRSAVSILFDEQGRGASASRALEAVVASGMGLESGTAVLLPPIGTDSPPGQIDGRRFSAHGLGWSGVQDLVEVVVPSSTADGGVVGVRAPVASLAVRAITGLDPRLGLVDISVDGDVTDAQSLAWADGVADGRLALAQEILGACRSMVDLACVHARERVQFGQPIARFQAVRHRLADAFTASEAAEAAVEVAWRQPSPDAAMMAKVLAGRAAKIVGKHAQQVLAGMGFTKEHPFHRFLFRAQVLDHMLGSSRDLTRARGLDLLAARRSPALVPL